MNTFSSRCWFAFTIAKPSNRFIYSVKGKHFIGVIFSVRRLESAFSSLKYNRTFAEYPIELTVTERNNLSKFKPILSPPSFGGKRRDQQKPS